MGRVQILKTNRLESRLESIDFFEKVYDYVFRALSEDVCLKALSLSPDDISFCVCSSLSQSTVLLEQSIVFLEYCREQQDDSVEPRCRSLLIVKIDLETLQRLKYRSTRRLLRLTSHRQRRRLLKAAIGKVVYSAVEAVYGTAAAHGSFKVCLGDMALVDVSSIEEFLVGIDLTCTVQA